MEGLKNDFRKTELDAKDSAMLEYAAKLTLEPQNMAESDVEKLRNNGFSDEAILDICLVASCYALVNRLAKGLGVELEDFWRSDRK